MSLLGIVLSLLGARLVQAKVESRLNQGLGKLNDMLFTVLDKPPSNATGALHRGKAQALTINGITLLSQATYLDASSQELDAVFARMKTLCQRSIEEPPPAKDEELLMSAPMIERRGPLESYIYCIQPRRRLDLSGIEATVKSYSTSGDLDDVGRFQGVYVRSNGSSHRLLVLQSEGAIHFTRAFPRKNDAPGRDAPALPRPPGRRTFSIGLDDRPLMNIYELTDHHTTPSQRSGILDDYAAQLRSAGINVIFNDGPEGGLKGSLVARTSKETYLVFQHHIDQEGSHFRPSLSVTRLVQ